MSQPARKQSKDMQTYADIKHGTTNKSTRTIASMYSATFGHQMLMTAHIRALMEEEEIKNLLQKDKGKDNEFEHALEQNDELASMDFHKVEMATLLRDLETNEQQGLTTEQAKAKLAKVGPNKLNEKTPLPWYIKLLLEMVGIFSLLLWAGSILCFIAYGLQPSDPSNLYLGIVIAAVVIVSGIFSYYQNSKSEAIMAKFKDFIPPRANAIRNGKRDNVEAVDLVPGDIIEVSNGDKIPADIRMIWASEMRVDNSSLTGESDPLERSSARAQDKEKILEAKNMAFFGTKCVEGKCKGVVVLTGPRTIIGRIASLAQSAEQGETTLATDLSKFMKLIGWIAVSLGVLFFCLGFVYNNDVITNFVYAIGIIVANVPEGLLITLTITLAATAARLAQNNVLVKNLQSVETLGSTSCICSDKTGTLTQNRMTPAHALVSLRDFECGLGKDEYELALKNKRSVKHIMYEDSLLQMFAKYLILCSAVEISEPSNDDLAEHIAKDLGLPGAKDLKPEVFEANKEKTLKKIIATTLIKERKTAFGNPTEAGMIKFVSTFMDYLKIRKDWPLAFEIPFSSALKYNVMIRRVQSEMDKSFQRYVVILKGASERVLKRCDKIFVGGSVVPMTEEQRKAVDRKNTEFASNGERVLGLAYMDLDPAKYNESFKFSSQGDEPNFPTTKLVFLGLMSLMDPPRVDVEKSVDKCREAGIKVIMVTGDQPETAKAIAHQCHIITDLSKEYGNMMKAGMSKEQAEIECQAMVIHGDEVAIRHKLDSKKLPDDPEKDLYLQQWLRKKEVVFARMNPAQKLIIVDACQKLGHIVTVTGDGVNDSPALEKANIGIAMGSGSDVAKDVADMVLLTDDFTSIVIGVEQGRLIFDNLKKSIVYTLASNIPELVPFLLYIVLQIPLPLTTILILFIDVGTDLWPAISFAYEGPELDIMKRKPRIPDKDLLVSRKVMIFAYLEIGIIEGFAGMFAYFTVMHDYGFKPMNLFFFAFEKGCESPASDTRQYDWTTTDDRKRTVMDFYSCAKAGNLKYAQASYYVPVSDTLDTVSSVTNEKVRYTSEALRYAQSSFWVAIVITQWADLLICKTRSLSLAQHGFNNMPSFYGLIFETALAVVIMYVPFLHEPLGTRPLDIRHLGVNVFPFFTIIILYDEARKYLMHKFSDIRPGKRPVYAWLYRNTFY